VSRWFRWASRTLLFGRSVASLAQTTLTAGTFAPVGNGSATSTQTLTVRTAGGAVMPGASVTNIRCRQRLISASLSTVTADPAAIDNDGVASSTITSVLYNTESNPVVGLPAANAILAVTGTGNTVTQPAAASTFAGIQTGSFVSTNAATKTASITAAGLAITDTASIVVGTPVADLTPVFYSDWAGRANGTSTDSRGDGGKWDYLGAGGSIVDNSGLDFPATMPKLYLANWDVNGGWAFHRKTGMSIPAVGDTRYYRWYARIVHPNPLSISNENHPWQDGFSGGVHNWLVTVGGGGPLSLGLRPGTPPATYPDYRWTSNVGISINTTYRFEVAVTRTGTTTMKMYLRLYNSAGTLLIDNDDLYRCDAVPGPITLGNSDPTFTLYDVNAFGGLNGGCNNTGDAGSGYNFSYEGGFAVCDNQGWIGAYGTVVGES